MLTLHVRNVRSKYQIMHIEMIGSKNIFLWFIIVLCDTPKVAFPPKNIKLVPQGRHGKMRQ